MECEEESDVIKLYFQSHWNDEQRKFLKETLSVGKILSKHVLTSDVNENELQVRYLHKCQIEPKFVNLASQVNVEKDYFYKYHVI